MGITFLDTQSFRRNAFSNVFPQLDIMESKARRVSIRNTETHGSIISRTQDVTNRGEPISFADSLLESLWQAPVLGKDSGERALPHDWNNSRNKRQRMENRKTPCLFIWVAKRVGEEVRECERGEKGKERE